MIEHSFSVNGEPRLEIRLPVGDLKIVPAKGEQLVVRLDGRSSSIERFVVDDRGGTIFVEPDGTRLRGWSHVDLTIESPAPPSVHARLTSADFVAGMELASLAVETASGDVSALDVAGDFDVRSASGDVRTGTVGGRISVASASGDVRAESGAEAEVKSASGDVYVGVVSGDAVVHTASGDVTVDQFAGDRLVAKSMSGDVVVGVVGGRQYEVSFSSLSGDIRTNFPVSEGSGIAPARLDIKTVSGDILIRGARD